MPARMPVVFVPHGGGPWPFVDLGIPSEQREPLAQYLRGGDLTGMGEEGGS